MSTNEVILSIVTIVIGVSIIGTSIIAGNHLPGERWFGTPKYFFEDENLNLLGKVMLSIIIFLFAWPVYIILFIHWICHVHIGKKNKGKR